MITTKEIKDLAQEYVDELFAYDDMSEQENIENKNDALVLCMAFAGHILEKHCVVTKSKLKDEFKINQGAIIVSTHLHEADLIEFFKGRNEQLEDIFGASLFNEEKG